MTKTHVNEQLDTQRELHGNSRNGGDAPPEIQQKIVDIIIEEARKRKFSNRDISYYIAVAKRESGFNPDAANDRSTAAGIAQMLDDTGDTYGLNDKNRFDARANISAGLQYFWHLKEKIIKDYGSATGQYEALIYYCYHYGEFSINRREKINGKVVVKEPYPFTQLEGTPKYLDSQTVVDEAARIEKILNDTHGLQVQLMDIMGKPMVGRKVVVVQKRAVNTQTAIPVTPTASTDTPIVPAVENAEPAASPGKVEGQSAANICVPPPSEPTPTMTWELVALEVTTNSEGQIPEVASDTQERVLVLIPRIDYEAYNKAVADYSICEDGNKHRLAMSSGEQGALPTIKSPEPVPVTPAPATGPVNTPKPAPKTPAVKKNSETPSLSAAMAQDKKHAQFPQPSPSADITFNDIVIALKKNLGWENVFETSFAYAKQFYTRPKLPAKLLSEKTIVKKEKTRIQVVNSSIKNVDVKSPKVKNAVTTAIEPVIKKVEISGDAPWMNFAIEEQGKNVTENTLSHVNNKNWQKKHEERTDAETTLKKKQIELNQEKRKSEKIKDTKKIEELEKQIQEQISLRDAADEEMKVIESKSNNSDIVKYLQSTNLPRDMARDDGTAWCASFLNWCIKSAGYKGLADGAARAENWKNWGEKIDEPRYGAITIVTRSATQFHVGFYTGIQEVSVKDGQEEIEVVDKKGNIKKIKRDKHKMVKKVRLLSGNYSNQIIEAAGWAVDALDDPKLHLVEYRWPTAQEKK